MFKTRHKCNKEEFVEKNKTLDYESHKFEVQVLACPRCDEYFMNDEQMEEFRRKVRDELGSTNLQD